VKQFGGLVNDSELSKMIQSIVHLFRASLYYSELFKPFRALWIYSELCKAIHSLCRLLRTL